jgi:hypothetical protein
MARASDASARRRPIGRWHALAVASAFVLPLAGGLVADVTGALVRGDGAQTHAQRADTAARALGEQAEAPQRRVELSFRNFRKGHLLRDVERRVEKASAIADWSRPYWSELLYRLLRATTREIVAGRGRWLFFEQSLDYPGDAPRRIAVSCAWIEAGAIALRAREIDCAIMAVPSKAAVYPDRLPLGAPDLRPRYAELAARLRERGLWAPDVLALLAPHRERLLYRPDDTHWTNTGQDVASRGYASALRAAWPDLPRNARTERTYRELSHERGDLVRMASFYPGGELELSFRCTEVIPRVTLESRDGRWPVVLTGDSFAAGWLNEYLSEHLACAVEDAALPGRGPSRGLANVLESLASGKRSVPELVVWEFTERQMRLGTKPSFEALLRALPRAYAERYRVLAPLGPADGPGPPHAWSAPAWLVPGNGTCALRYDSRSGAATEVAVAAQLAWFPLAGEPTQRVPAGESAVVLPLVRPGWYERIGLLYADGKPPEGAIGRAELLTAYRPVRGLELDARGALRVDLGAEHPLDGTRALALEVHAPAAGPDASGELALEGGAVASDAFPLARARAAPVRVLVPLRAPLAAGQGAATRASVLVLRLHGAGAGADVRALELHAL